MIHAAFADGVGPHSLAVALGAPLTEVTLEVEFFAPLRMTHHLPRSSPTVGGSVLNLFGDGFVPGRHRAHFGSVEEPVDVVSSVLARCVVPPRRFIGDVLLQMSEGEGDDRDVVADGLATGLHTYYTQPVITGFTPDKAKSPGGLAITIAGEHFRDVDTLSCKFGTVSHVAATFDTDQRIICKAPARKPGFWDMPLKGINPLEVSINSYDHTNQNMTIEYEPGGEDLEGGEGGLSALEALGLIDGYTLMLDVLTVTGPVTGGTVSMIEGANFHQVDTTCKFQSTQTAGIFVSKFRFICITPPNPAGFVAYELIAGTEVTTFGFQFHYHPIVKVTLLEPNFASTSGGDVVLVNGKNFIRRAELGEMPDKVSTFCAMGTTGYEEGHFISSALVACETVAFPQEADVAMEISAQPRGQVGFENRASPQAQSRSRRRQPRRRACRGRHHDHRQGRPLPRGVLPRL